MRILTVDDDPAFLALIRAYLADLGYRDVVQADTAGAAIALVTRSDRRFDCVLLDIDMPGTDGIALCAQLRGLPQAARVPIVMVTARTETDSVERAFAAGATDYLTKPLNRTDLRGRLAMAQTIADGRDGTPSPSPGDPVSLPGAPAFIDFLALQNYLLKLGSMRSLNRAIACIRVDNIADIHATKPPGAFTDTLLDIAELIAEATGPGQKLISYAGSGNFILVTGRRPGFDPQETAYAMEPALTALTEWYAAAGEVAPRIVIGPAVTRGVFSFVAPDDLIAHALQAVGRQGCAVRCLSAPDLRRTA